MQTRLKIKGVRVFRLDFFPEKDENPLSIKKCLNEMLLSVTYKWPFPLYLIYFAFSFINLKKGTFINLKEKNFWIFISNQPSNICLQCSHSLRKS